MRDRRRAPRAAPALAFAAGDPHRPARGHAGPPILLAAGLNVAAVAGLADIAGFHAVYASLTRIQWPWLCAVPAAPAMSAIGYYLAYRRIYAAEGGYALTRRQLTAMVAAGFSGLFSAGANRPDGLVLQASGASRREAMVRVTTLAGMEQAMLAAYGCAASIAWLCLGRAGVPVDFTLPRSSRSRRIGPTSNRPAAERLRSRLAPAQDQRRPWPPRTGRYAPR